MGDSSIPGDSCLDHVIVGTFIHSVRREDIEILKNAVVGVKEGQIVFIDRKENLQKLLEKFSLKDDRVFFLDDHQFVIPGFVDSHAHAPQYPFMGTGSDLQLLPWLEKYTYPTETKVATNHDYALDVYTKCVERTLRSGSTTVCYYATIDRKSTTILVDVIERMGQRAYVGKVNMDQESPAHYCEDTQHSINETKLFIQDTLAKKSPIITPCITPRFAVTCSTKLMSQLGQLAEEFSLPIQTHISENKHEIELVSKLFPGSSSYADVYDQANLLSSKTVLGHAVHLSLSELELLQRRGSGISHCPNSNFCLHSGVLDVRIPLNMGVKVGLGTDFAGGNSPSMLDAIRRGVEAATVNSLKDQSAEKRISYKDMFYLATVGSSQVMGLDDKIGNFMVGKDFDALIVDPRARGSPFDIFEGDGIDDVLQKFLFQGDDRNIHKIYVRGKILHTNKGYCK